MKLPNFKTILLAFRAGAVCWTRARFPSAWSATRMGDKAYHCQFCRGWHRGKL